MSVVWSIDLSSGPASEPVTTADAKDQCEIASSVTAHDAKLDRYIAAARQQYEDDTDEILINQTWTMSGAYFPSVDTDLIALPLRPVSSISSITYYDTDDAQQTLATSVYGLDTARNAIYLKNDQDWPDVNGQHNGIVITFVVGHGADATSVPETAKQAILLQVCRWFIQDRGDEMPIAQGSQTAYDRLIRRHFRRSYP